MNKLYSILIGTTPVSGWYFKRSSLYMITDRINEIRAILLQDVPEEKLPMFVCALCALVRLSTFGNEILALDANNTYQDITRPADAEHNDAAYCIHDLIKPASAFSTLRRYLADDISTRLNYESWIELMGAGCLQLLREV